MQEDKVVLVTGASKGLGQAVVQRSLAHGYRVAATSRDAKSLASQVNASGERFLPLEVALTDEASIAEAVSRTRKQFGRIDVLVNNAGYSVLGAVEEISDAEVRANFDINVFGVLNMLRAVLPIMREQRSGHVINIASISGSVGGPTTGIYSATKAAVILLSESLAEEVAEFGIKVTTICPGGFRTDFLDKSSSRHPAHSIPEYSSVHRVLEDYGRLNKRQGGDPERAADAMIALSKMGNPPARLYLGADAFRAIEYQLQRVADGVQQYQQISLSTGFKQR